MVSMFGPDFAELVARREPMPGVENYQTTFVRYKCTHEAQIAHSGWELSVSQRQHKEMVLAERARSHKPGVEDASLFDDSPLVSGLAPTAVHMRICEAPAEFAVPVKQDRRLTPHFKVRVDVRYSTRVSFPLTVKAHIISQQEKDSIAEWVPDDFVDPDAPQRKPVTELKGTTCITHHFEACLSGLGSGGIDDFDAEYTGHDSPNLALSKQEQLGIGSGLYGGLWSPDLDQRGFDPYLGKGFSPAYDRYQQYGGTGVKRDQYQPTNHASRSGRSHMEGSLSQEFEFANVEFVKPTRMNKVYIVFACSVMDQDVMFVVYNVPTVGICRAEQRAKACQKLGMSYGDYGHLEHMYLPPAHRIPSPPAGQELSGAQQLAAERSNSRKRTPNRDNESDITNLSGLKSFDNHVEPGHLPSSPYDGVSMLATPGSRLALREWILEEYDGTGLTRKLTALDLQALESQAGFTPESALSTDSISDRQWDEFVHQFQAVLQLLRQIAVVWNQEDPCCIAGFDMDRQGTVQALASEPAGTFICRFSMSQPGSLVLTCKVSPGHPNADMDGLVHAIIKIDDLYERRVDTWIRDFAGATHVLDVYKQKRVDKRKVFASNYTRLRAMESLDTSYDSMLNILGPLTQLPSPHAL